MTAPRRWAGAILRAVIAHTPDACREWATAMLHELDYIDGDWTALWWALGSVAAVSRHAVRELGRQSARYLTHPEERTMDNLGKKTGWLFAGMGVALVLGIVAALGFHLMIDRFPSLRPAGLPWLQSLILVVMPEIIFIAALWRKRRLMAVGVLVMSVAITAHLAVYFISHWNH